MVVAFKDYGLAVAEAIGAVVSRATKPSVRVARHWQATSRVTWFGACTDHHLIQASWSFGALRDGPKLEPGQRSTVGVFAVTKVTFPEVNDARLHELCEGMVPQGTDGATRVFLQRVASQFALADVLLTLPELLGCEISLFARPDAIDQPATTSRWPEHARERVAAALGGMDSSFAARCERTWSAESNVLLDAVRALQGRSQ